MLFIVDGTGDPDNRTYANDFRHSFCHQLHERTRHTSTYARGPTLLGFETTTIAAQVATNILMLAGTERVFLCGYSRGGAAVLTAAWNVRPRPIHAMFLFDAVDRATGTMAQ